METTIVIMLCLSHVYGDYQTDLGFSVAGLGFRLSSLCQVHLLQDMS